MIFSKRSSLTAALFAAIVFSGCEPAATTDSDETITTGPPSTVDDHDHAHPSEGPHHGSLIELGAEEYHAEFVHDEEAGTVTVYILDGAAESAVPIEAKEITINLKHDGEGEQFQLAGTADEGDPEGKVSKFVSIDTQLGKHLDEEGAEATLVLTINGKSYRGEIAHDHDHEHAH